MFFMQKQIRWGILGLGRIARSFAEGLKHTSNGTLHCVGSRDLNKAMTFAKEWKVANSSGSYEELAERQDIDAVYVATPHSEHARLATLCMNHGKAVLCEKPMAVNALQVDSMIRCAKENEVLLMEGMWTRFAPLMVEIRKILRSGALGEIKTLQADFGFRPQSRDPNSRLFSKTLAGGSMLDIGVYPISLSFMVFGKPSKIITDCHLGETGVDEQAAYVFKYPENQMAVLHSSLQVETAQEAFISGTEGTLKIHKQCWRPQKITVTKKGLEPEVISMPFEGNGFNYEAESFGKLFLAGEKESPIMPLEESLSIHQVMDEIREKWGMVYPMDEE